MQTRASEPPLDRQQLIAVSVERYRCFARQARLDLRPLTLLYGPNNAGKSAFLRVLPTLANSVAANATSAWEIGGRDGPGRGSSFMDMLWRGKRLKKMELTTHWRTAQGTRRDRFVLEYLDELPGVVVAEVEVTDEAGAVVLGAQALYHPKHETFQLADETELRPDFHGLVPRNIDAHAELGPLAQRMKTLEGGVQWLLGTRASPELYVRPADVRRVQMSPDGSEAASMVVGSAEIRESVRRFYADPEIGRDLRVESAGDGRHRLILDSPSRTEWRIPLVDVGASMGQVLPALVAAAQA